MAMRRALCPARRGPRARAAGGLGAPRIAPRLALESRAANGPAGVPRQAAVRPPRTAGLLRQGRHERRGRRRGGGRGRLPGRRQGPGPDRRPRQGRRRQARRRRGRGCASTRGTSSAWTSSGHIVRTLWIEHASDIASEYYASVLLDRSAKKPLVMFSVEGGVDIEEVAEKTPEKLIRHHVDPLEGLSPRGGGRDRHARAASTRTSSRASPTRSSRCTRCGCRRTRRWPRSTR